MMYKGYDFFPHGRRWRFMRWTTLAVGASLMVALISLTSFAFRGLNYGVDFKGGSLIEVQSVSGPLDLAKIRASLNDLNIGDVQVQAVGQGNEALVRIAQQPTEREQTQAGAKVKAALGDTITIRRTEVVGPTVSAELKSSGIWAVTLALLGIMLYVWFRFEWQFAVAGIVALCHDVLITAGMFSFLWQEFDLATVAALLTLAGYSINDTVVFFDRVRENLRKYKRMPFTELLDLSINETLSRTVLTALATFTAVLSLWLFGTEAIRGFAFAMLFGIVIGTYSTIFIAPPFLIWLGFKRENMIRDEAAEAGVAAQPGRPAQARSPKKV
jgi:preprotein translocase subunit SecF